MKKVFAGAICLIFCAGVSVAQRGKAEPDYYPMAYSGDTWTGEVTAYDNDRRTLTLTHGSGKNVSTFVASIPDAPYEWGQDAHRFRVVDFPFDKGAEYQTFKYVGPGFAATIAPGNLPSSGMQKRHSPPASNVINDLSEFMGRSVTVYYTTLERMNGSEKEKYNDVWRIRILPTKKK